MHPHSAERSPQVWFGKQKMIQHWQENNCSDYYYNYYTMCVTTYTQSSTKSTKFLV